MRKIYNLIPSIIFEIIAIYNIIFCIKSESTNNFLFIANIIVAIVGPIILYKEMTMFDKGE